VTRERPLPGSVRALMGAGAVLFWVVQLSLLFWGRLPLPDTVLLAALLVALPTFALAQLPLVQDTPIERLPAYWGSIVTLWLIGTACWLVGTRVGGAAALGVVWLPLLPLLSWSVGLTVAGLAVLVAFRQIAIATGVPESPMLRALLPRSTRERAAFALLSVAAGVGEELAYRGYAIPQLAEIMGVPAAVLLTSLVFGERASRHRRPCRDRPPGGARPRRAPASARGPRGRRAHAHLRDPGALTEWTSTSHCWPTPRPSTAPAS
jgi:membrane protease YdiL (CAAX protease family)